LEGAKDILPDVPNLPQKMLRRKLSSYKLSAAVSTLYTIHKKIQKSCGTTMHMESFGCYAKAVPKKNKLRDNAAATTVVGHRHESQIVEEK